ncbi:MAG: cytochrome c biogenesis protein ResB, partial [Trueperella sp.]|uniref:cytochrome c biogenesis protein ResB n=1 Tax=Trueperella sp. TaxID=2699835 RepID=UPI002A90A5C0
SAPTRRSSDLFDIPAAAGRTTPDLAPGPARIEVYESGSQETMDMKVVDQGQPATVAGLDITFEREAQYAGLIVRSDPGAWVVWLGSALLIIGSIMTMALRHQRMWAWVAATDDGSVLRLASHDKRDLGFSRYFHGFGTEITERITQGKEL